MPVKEARVDAEFLAVEPGRNGVAKALAVHGSIVVAGRSRSKPRLVPPGPPASGQGP